MTHLPSKRIKLFILGLIVGCLGGAAANSHAVEVGAKAPEFKLPATTGVDISLSDYRGKKWLLVEFYGAAFVPT